MLHRGFRHARQVAVAILVLLTLSPLSLADARQATPEASPVAAADVPAWTQFGIDGGLIARTLADGSCPDITVDGTVTPMTERARATADFPSTVCEAVLPSGTGSASIDGQPLEVGPASLNRIAVVGDTGCRIAKDRAQACNDPDEWPLVEISGQIAAWEPDLILHVGDYVYREAACPEENSGCAGSPYGDNEATWMADFLGPMASSLGSAPWIFLRGNHEDCDREGVGWFRMLDPGPVPVTCQPFTEPYSLEIDGARLLVMDTSATGDTKSTPELNAEFARQFETLGAMTTPGSWLLTHKPIAGGILRLDRAEHFVSNATVRETVDNNLPDGIDVVVSGHIHLAEALLFEAEQDLPTQIVSGNGGTMLDPGETATFSGQILENAAVDAGLIGASFGWMTLEPDGDRLTATAQAVDGGVLFRVHLPNPTAR